uniref:Probable RuBisCO transcriptional regulator n=1 Tax=prasinophyte sp. MBIC10622 TaxID=156113 RepID=A0A088CIR0_9CHLO|nr:transcriptional regulator [prasinophyte sp. MBIC10622]
MIPYPFTLKHLKTLKAISDFGSLTAAAQSLYISQPAISSQLREIEQSLQLKVLNRTRQGIEFTEVGYILLYYANKILSLCDETCLVIQDLHIYPHGSFTLGAEYNIGTYTLPKILIDYHISFTQTQINLELLSSYQTCYKLLDDKLDLGIVSGFIPPQLKPQLSGLFLGREEIVLVVPKGHPYALRPYINKQELFNLHFLRLNENSPISQIIEYRLKMVQIEPSALVWDLEVNSIDALKNLLLVSKKACFLPFSSIHEELSNELVSWIPIKGVQITQYSWILNNPSKYRLRAVEGFIERCLFSFSLSNIYF